MILNIKAEGLKRYDETGIIPDLGDPASTRIMQKAWDQMVEVLDMLKEATPDRLDHQNFEIVRDGEMWRVKAAWGWIVFRFEGQDVADVVFRDS